ncbi:MAG: hypothetical protein ABJF23_24245 [Bryobacteraceae bacterium]
MRLVLLFAILSVSLLAQRPVIDRGGVRNSASYTPGVRGLVTIFGSNLANSTEIATTTPLPTMLGGTRVTFGGKEAFLLYVSPKQINLQVPFPVSSEDGRIIVSTAAGSSDEYTADNSQNYSQMGLFTTNENGCGQASALNVSAETGAISVNSPSNSASPGDYISLYGTGLYAYKPRSYIPDGNPAPNAPLYSAGPDAFTVDFQNPARATWEGVAPGLIGVDQFNLKLAPTTREGCAVPVQVMAEGSSRPVTVAVRKGGGPCVDPTAVGYGEITWERSAMVTTANTAVSETLSVSLQSSPGRTIPSPPSYIDHDDRFLQSYYVGPSCPIPGYRSLDAGTVTAQLTGGNVDASTVPVPNTQIAGLMMYEAALPAGTIQPGTFRLSATGGAGSGAFHSSVRIGSGIQITTALANKTIPTDQPLIVNWIGGDPDSWVTVKLVGPLGIQTLVRRVQVRASAGTARMELMDGLLLVPRLNELIVEVTPNPDQIVTFAAPGLEAIRHSWKYSYHFSVRQ